jgi:hypothetical protein
VAQRLVTVYLDSSMSSRFVYREYVFGVALAVWLVLVIDYALGWTRWGLVEFAWTPLNTFVVLAAWIFPLFTLLYLPPVRPGMRRALGTVLVLATIGEGLVALLTLLYVPLTIRTGYDSGQRPLYAVNAGRDRLVVYDAPPFAIFEPYNITVRQERGFVAGLVRARGLYTAKARDASVQTEGVDSLRITTWSQANRSGQATDTVIPFEPLP